jgi:hypothetical protein
VGEHGLSDIPRRHARDAADLADAVKVGGFLEQMLRINLRVGPVAPDLLRVVGNAFDLVLGARAEEYRAKFVTTGEAAKFGEDLDLAGALTGEIEETSRAATAEEAKAVA